MWIYIMAIAIELFLAEETSAAENVKRYQYVIPDLQLLNRRANLFHNSCKFMTERASNPGIRY
jgi:hypothetical protein